MIWIASIAGCYGLLVLGVFLFQDRLLFVAAGAGRGKPLDLPEGVEVQFLSVDPAWSVRMATCPPRNTAKGVALFFDGNGGDLRSGVRWARLLADCDMEAIAMEYPGYGESGGTPSKVSFERTALAAVELARARAKALDLPLIACGVSLGSFCAVHLAAQQRVDRMVLLAPPSRLADAAAMHFWWLPVRWLLRHPFDNLEAAPRVRCPTLIVHGDRDRVVPVEMGKELAAAMAPVAELFIAPGAGHNDLWFGSEARFALRIREFLHGR